MLRTIRSIFRKIRIVVYILLFLFSVFALGLHMYFKKYGRELVRSRLEQAFHHPVKVGAVKTRFPLDLVVRDVEIEGLGSVEEAVASGGMMDSFNGNFFLGQLTLKHAHLQLTKPARKEVADESEGGSDVPPVQEIVIKIPPSPPAPPVQQMTAHYIFIKHLVMLDSEFTFIDPNAGDSGIKIPVRHIEANIRNFQFPAVSPVVTSFRISASVPSQDMKEEGRIKFNGWIDLVAKSMDADFKAVNIDALAFNAYLSDWMDMKQEHVAKARFDFSSKMTGIHNDVAMKCHLEMTEVQFKDRAEEPEQKEGKLSVIFGLVKAFNQGRIQLNFTMRTRMDSPEFGFGVIRREFETKVYEAMRADFRPGLIKTPVRVAKGTITAASDFTKGVVSGTVGIFKAMGSGLKSAFNKDREK